MFEEDARRVCSICGVEKPLTEFYVSKGSRGGRRGDCKQCFRERAAARYRANPEPAKERARRWTRENPERVRERMRAYRASGKKAVNDRRSYLKRKYGVTPEQYDDLLASQGGGCAICARPPTGRYSLHVDHDHESGVIRGLLCFSCNNALGDFDDDPVLIADALAYVEAAMTVRIRGRARQLVEAAH